MLYDYQCSECGHEMNDVQQSMKDEALTKCPKCKKNSLERIIYGGIHASVKGGEPTTLGQMAERRFEEGHTRMPDGRPITRVEYNQSDMVERKEKRIHEATARRKKKEEQQKQIKKINNMTPEQKRNYIRNGE